MTLEKGLLIAVNVENVLLVARAFFVIREFTAEKGLMSAVNVGNLFLLAVAFGIIRVHLPRLGLICQMGKLGSKRKKNSKVNQKVKVKSFSRVRLFATP